MNNKISPKERGLIKGALRRVFSRSDLRRQVIDAAEVEHSDPSRPRVKKWIRCEQCKDIKPKYLAVVDHLIPLIPLDSSLEDMTWDEVISRLWCDVKNLQVLCQDPCHLTKTKLEAKVRRDNKRLKKGLTDVKPERVKKTAKKCMPGIAARTTHKRVRKCPVQNLRAEGQRLGSTRKGRVK